MPEASEERSTENEDPFRRTGEADAWNAFSYVLSGMLLWGGVGWLLSLWLGSRALIGVGLMVGTGAGLALVWLRYGRSQ
jgi:F0F1-type ATP synthase assembly protein I